MLKRHLGVLGLAFFPCGLLAATVRVHVADHQGAPVEAAEVKLVNAQSGEAKNTMSATNGDAEFDQIAAGTYQVTARKPRLVGGEINPVTIGDSDVTIEVKLAAEDALKKLVSDANEAFKKKKYQDAADRYARALAFFPKDASMWAYLAKSQQMTNEMDKATESVKQATKYDPAKYEILEKEIVGVGNYEAGKKYLAQKEFSEAADSFSRSVKADATYAPAFYGLALCYANQGKYPQALENVQQALKLDPSNTQYKKIEQELKQAMGSGK
jgi:tetratricopeptide (TPR) repeat protein